MSERHLAGEKPLWVRSMYGAQTREPYVVLELGEEKSQLPPEQARMVAAWLNGAAEAAMQDAFMVEWMQETFDLEIERAAVILQEYRTYRRTRLEK